MNPKIAGLNCSQFKRNSDYTVPFLLILHPWNKIDIYKVGVRNLGMECLFLPKSHVYGLIYQTAPVLGVAYHR